MRYAIAAFVWHISSENIARRNILVFGKCFICMAAAAVFWKHIFISFHREKGNKLEESGLYIAYFPRRFFAGANRCNDDFTSFLFHCNKIYKAAE